MESFRLLHISDFHIATQEKVFGFPDRKYRATYPVGWRGLLSASSYDLELARAVAKYAFFWGERIDAILITGDLATTGDRGDLDLAVQYVDVNSVHPTEIDVDGGAFIAVRWASHSWDRQRQSFA